MDFLRFAAIFLKFILLKFILWGTWCARWQRSQNGWSVKYLLPGIFPRHDRATGCTLRGRLEFLLFSSCTCMDIQPVLGGGCGDGGDGCAWGMPSCDNRRDTITLIDRWFRGYASQCWKKFGPASPTLARISTSIGRGFYGLVSLRVYSPDVTVACTVMLRREIMSDRWANEV